MPISPDSQHRKNVCTGCIVLLNVVAFVSCYLGTQLGDPKFFVLAGFSGFNAFVTALTVKYGWRKD